MAFNSGKTLPDDLLREAGTSHRNLVEAHFFIAMDELSQGHREAARNHFEEAVRTRVFIWLDYHWSKAFLGRMNADPEWPKWIPLKRP